MNLPSLTACQTVLDAVDADHRDRLAGLGKCLHRTKSHVVVFRYDAADLIAETRQPVLRLVDRLVTLPVGGVHGQDLDVRVLRQRF